MKILERIQASSQRLVRLLIVSTLVIASPVLAQTQTPGAKVMEKYTEQIRDIRRIVRELLANMDCKDFSKDQFLEELEGKRKPIISTVGMLYGEEFEEKYENLLSKLECAVKDNDYQSLVKLGDEEERLEEELNSIEKELVENTD
ncbi:MAG: hypothetical protein PHU71_02595 [Candidatus Gracilibacteria bacterium]|nr:hypothetical protein [Candidatus Gracilibacteria bacterium]